MLSVVHLKSNGTLGSNKDITPQTLQPSRLKGFNDFLCHNYNYSKSLEVD